MYCTVSIYGITSGKVEVGGQQRKYDAVVEVDQLGTRNESSAESSIIYTHTQYLHLAKSLAWIDILFYKQQG